MTYGASRPGSGLICAIGQRTQQHTRRRHHLPQKIDGAACSFLEAGPTTQDYEIENRDIVSLRRTPRLPARLAFMRGGRTKSSPNVSDAPSTNLRPKLSFPRTASNVQSTPQHQSCPTTLSNFQRTSGEYPNQLKMKHQKSAEISPSHRSKVVCIIHSLCPPLRTK